MAFKRWFYLGQKIWLGHNGTPCRMDGLCQGAGDSIVSSIDVLDDDIDTAKESGWLKQIVQHVGWYVVGAVGPLVWYGVHFREQWTNGEKWRIFIDDLKIMWAQDSLSDQLNAPTTWGPFLLGLDIRTTGGISFIRPHHRSCKSSSHPLCMHWDFPCRLHLL